MQEIIFGLGVFFVVLCWIVVAIINMLVLAGDDPEPGFWHFVLTYALCVVSVLLYEVLKYAN